MNDQAIRDAEQRLELAIAELQSFDRRWANTVFRSKDHERHLLVNKVEDARLALLRTRQASENESAKSDEQRRIDDADAWLRSQSPPVKITDDARAERLGITPRTIRHWRSEGLIS